MSHVAGSQEQGACANAVQDPVSRASSKGSQGALVKSVSFETPLGVLRQNSSSTIEPVRMHSGHSQETFRREMSMAKLKSMPAITEDDDVTSDDEEAEPKHTGKGKYTAKGKREVYSHKCKAPCECCKKYHVIEEVSNAKTKVKVNRIGAFFRGLFLCTAKSTAADDQRSLDPDILLDVRTSGK